MCDAFVSNGHEVLLLARKPSKADEVACSDIYEFYGVKSRFPIEFYWYNESRQSRCRHLGGTVASAASIAFKLFRSRPDLVFGRDPYGCHVAATLGYPVIYETHWVLHSDSIIDRYIMNRLANHKNIKRFVVISEALATQVVKGDHPVSREKLLVAPDGADIVQDDRLPEFWPGRRSALQVGYVGGLYRGRGISMMLEMARRLPDYDFHFVGGSQDDIAKHTVRGMKNVFFHGYVAPGEVYSYRNKCDILLAPYQKKVSVAGGLGDTSGVMSPLKVFEYMSSGRAMLVSDMPVLHEVLTSGVNCLMASPDSLDAWVEALEQLRDPILRANLASAAKKEFLAKYTWQKRAETVVSACPDTVLLGS